MLKWYGHNSQGSTWKEESKKGSKNNAVGGRSVNIGVDSLTAAPMDNEGQRLNDWMQRRIAQTKKDGLNFTQRKGDDVPKQRRREREETEVRTQNSGSSLQGQIPKARTRSTTTNKVQTPGVRYRWPTRNPPFQRHRKGSTATHHHWSTAGSSSEAQWIRQQRDTR